MCKTVLLAGFIIFCAGLMQAEEADPGDIVVALDALDACVETGADTAAVKNARDILRRYEE